MTHFKVATQIKHTTSYETTKVPRKTPSASSEGQYLKTMYLKLYYFTNRNGPTTRVTR
jgi:hypothetical protein